MNDSKDALSRAEIHLRTMPPHVRARLTAQLLEQICAELREARKALASIGAELGPLAAQLRAALEQLDACKAFLEAAEAENAKLNAELAGVVNAQEAPDGR